jgi:hypothetical protein
MKTSPNKRINEIVNQLPSDIKAKFWRELANQKVQRKGKEEALYTALKFIGITNINERFMLAPEELDD